MTFEQKIADSPPVFVAKDAPIEQHLQAVQDAKAEANLSDETPFCPTLKFASRTFSLLRERRSVLLLHVWLLRKFNEQERCKIIINS